MSEQPQQQQKPSALDHLQALAMRYEELVRASQPANLGADMLANATVHATAISDALTDLAGMNDKLKHVVERQQEELNKQDSEDRA